MPRISASDWEGRLPLGCFCSPPPWEGLAFGGCDDSCRLPGPFGFRCSFSLVRRAQTSRQLPGVEGQGNDQEGGKEEEGFSHYECGVSGTVWIEQREIKPNWRFFAQVRVRPYEKFAGFPQIKSGVTKSPWVLARPFEMPSPVMVLVEPLFLQWSGPRQRCL